MNYRQKYESLIQHIYFMKHKSETPGTEQDKDRRQQLENIFTYDICDNLLKWAAQEFGDDVEKIGVTKTYSISEDKIRAIR